MIVDPQTIPPREMYRFIISVVVPRPIAFVSSVSAEGRFNLAPFSFFTGLTSEPPLVGISINARGSGPKDTLRNIRASGDYVINVVDDALAERMVRASGDWPPDVSEFEITGLTPLASDLVKAPRVAECPVSMECRLYREVPLGDTTFVIGEILRGHVADDRVTDGKVDPAKLRPLGRLGGDGYTTIGELLQIPRPRVPRVEPLAGG